MAGHTVLLNLLGGIALLLWATRMVRTGVLRAFGEGFRRAVARATSNPLRACLTGIGIASAVQSSSATGLIVVSFAERGLITLAAALAVMLGADVGSTLVVQALSFDLAALVPALLIAGVAAFMAFESTAVRHCGRILIGLALTILSLQMVVAASGALRGSAVLALVLQRLAATIRSSGSPATLVTWLFHSSVATACLLVISLASAATIPPALGLALVLGANVGSGLIPIGLSLKSPPAAKRVLFGNFAFRLRRARRACNSSRSFADRIAATESDPARLLANVHTLFNLALALLFLPLVAIAAGLLQRLVPDAPAASEPTIAHLDEGLLDRPGVALGGATREVMRLADMVEIMLRETILAFGTAGEAPPGREAPRRPR